MIRYLGCDAAREMLQPFLDHELPMAEQVELESHLRWCDTCGARLDDMRLIGAALRVGAAVPPVHPEDAGAMASIQSAVLTRIRAERDQSFRVRFREAFADMHFFWPALGASIALVGCLFAVTTVNRVIRVEHPYSMADRLTTLANPGSDRNPLPIDMLMLAPRPLTEGPALESMSDEEAVFALAAIVTREGRISDYELLQAVRESRGTGEATSSHDEVNALLDAVKESRFAPAQTPEGAVAVNMVWLLARTTVKASIDPNDPGLLAPLTGPDEVVKPLSDGLERPAPRPARS
jgi:Putative zinc-finger